MQLHSFRVTNYRSIIDSKECYLSQTDGITILAGQNESGKSSLLESLKHYQSGTACMDAYRDEEDLEIRPMVTCSYRVEKEDDIHSRLLGLVDIQSELEDILEADEFKSYLENLDNFKISRTIGNTKTTYLALLGYDIELNKVVSILKENEAFKDITEYKIRLWLAKALLRITPKIILFDELFDILPDKFYLDELSEDSTKNGSQAVRNVESILGADFSELDEYSDNKITKKQREFEATLTADFNERWRQRIGDEKGATISVTYHQGGKDGRAYLRFFIQTRAGELLPPQKRSLGFKWFLSFYLHLTAEDKNNSNLILLFDEPGSHLHSKAQYDMLRVFEELSRKNQIIYATHSPYLIDAENLHRVRLIFNTQDAGTTIEKITTKLSVNQKDAIKPIIDALGMSVAHSFSAAKDRNVIVEGLSDYYYLSAAKKLLAKNGDFYFMPAMGAPNAHLLMELCIGWGLRWLMIFDEKGSAKEVKKIKTQFFSNDKSIDGKIYTIKGCDGIEDIFTEEDIKLAAPDFARTTDYLSKDLKAYGGKELIGRFFLDKVEADEITFAHLSEKAQNHLKEIFTFIEQGFK
jgi:predicted ATP-dependent endonuclease of OLD family